MRCSISLRKTSLDFIGCHKADRVHHSIKLIVSQPFRLVFVVASMLGVVFLSVDTKASAQSIFVVNPSGESSLQEQLLRLERLRSKGHQQAVEIVLEDGTYRLEKTIRLTPKLIGKGLTIRARNAGQVVLSGGRPLSQEKRDGEGRWHLRLPADWNRFGTPRTLVIDGKLSTAARHPNQGYFRIEKSLSDRRSGFVANQGDLPEGLEGQCDLVLLHDWSSSRLPVASYDQATRTLRTVGPIGCRADHYSIDHFEKQPRFYLVGHSLFADVAGEWFIDEKAGEVIVVGSENRDECPQIVLPWLEQILAVAGDETPVTNLRIEGIAFTESRFAMPVGGYAGAQATMHEPRNEKGELTTTSRNLVQAAVSIENATKCRVRNCDLRALAGTGLWVGGRTKDCAVDRCRFTDLGGNGLNLGEDSSRRVDGRTWHDAKPDQVPTNNRVEHCVISHCGKVLPGAVAIWAALHRNLEIADNHIHDCPYTGISIGWIWNDRESPAGGNVIRDNRIEFVMQVLSDGGGVYTLGRQVNSVISGNRISDIPLNAGRAESNGMFLDQGSTGFTISENTIRRIDRSPLRFHQAGGNLVENNQWELATDETPPVRYNRTPTENIQLKDNETLQEETSYFLIGNSLTWDTSPSRLDGNAHWHVDCGKNLDYIFNHHQSPCVSSSRLWPLALRTSQYDYVSVQPHYGTDLKSDLTVISNWMAKQPQAIFVIHTGWARHADWRTEADDGDAAGPLTHSNVYFDELIRQLRMIHPDRVIRRTKAMDYLHQIAHDIESGTAPLRSIDELYRDAIHMTTSAGRYLMHNTMRQAFDQPPSSDGFSSISPELKSYLDSILNAAD